MSSFPFFSQFSEDSVDEHMVIDISEKGKKSFNEISSQCSSGEIKVLKIANNLIPEFDIDFFKKFNMISYMDVSGNLLKSISGIEILQNLILVDFSKNQIKSLKGIDNNQMLRRILASKNEIESVDIEKPMPNVVLLDLHKNKISDLGFANLFPSLIELYIGNNKIDSLELIPSFTNLKCLSVANNTLTKIAPLSHPILTEIDVSGTGITNISYFRGCPALTKLNISKNPINKNGIMMDEPLPGIKTIKAAFTQIEESNFLFDMFPNAEVVSVAGCKLDSITKFEGLLRKSTTLRSIDTRWNPVCENFYVDETEDSVKTIWDSLREYNKENRKSRHRRRKYRNIILSINQNLEILDGIKIMKVIETNDTDSDYSEPEEEEEKNENVLTPSTVKADDIQLPSSQPFLDEEEEEEEKKQESNPIIDASSEADDENIDDSCDDAVTPSTIKTSEIGCQTSGITTEISTSISLHCNTEIDTTKSTKDTQDTSINFAVVDDKKKEEMAQKLKIENKHLEDQLLELKQFNKDLEERLRKKSNSFEEIERELSILRQSAEMKERSTADAINSTTFDRSREPRNNELLMKILDLLTQQNNFLVKELRKIKHKTQKKYPTFKDVVSIVDFLIGGNKTVIQNMKKEEEESKSIVESYVEEESDETSRIKYLAEQLKEQNKLLAKAIQRVNSREEPKTSTLSSHHHHHHSHSSNDYSRSKQSVLHHQHQHRSRHEEEPTQSFEYAQTRKTPEFEPENCEKRILGYARKPYDSQFAKTLDPNSKESKLLLFWSQYAVSEKIEQVYCIKAATTERFIEAEHKFGQLKVFVVPCEDPVLFFDSFFPKSVVAFRTFHSKPNIRSFLIIACDPGTCAFAETQPEKADEKRFRKSGYHSVSFMTGGSDALLILDTQRIVPIYSVTVA